MRALAAGLGSGIDVTLVLITVIVMGVLAAFACAAVLICFFAQTPPKVSKLITERRPTLWQSLCRITRH